MNDKVADIATFELTDDDIFTSDTHFFHKNVIKYCNRPWCCQHSMNEGLINNWNEVVKSDQRVFVLGDFAFGSFAKQKRVFERLNGSLYIIKGNHDYGRNKLIEMGFAGAYMSAIGSYNLYGKEFKILMRHIPDKENFSQYDLHLCGHVHTAWTKTENIINVGVDSWGYKPQKLRYLIENADRVQAAMPEQKTLYTSWEERNNELVKHMYERDKV